MPADQMPTWERRFRAPILSFPAWSESQPDRLVLASTESGSYQLHAWDRATGRRRQVTHDPVGVLEGRPTRDGTGVIWFRDETGAETAVSVMQVDHAIHPIKMKVMVGDRLVPYLEEENGRMAADRYLTGSEFMVSAQDVGAWLTASCSTLKRSMWFLMNSSTFR